MKDRDFEDLCESIRQAGEMRRNEICNVCGPPVQMWWPVHFTLCSNQNPLASEFDGGVVRLYREATERISDE